LVLLENEVRLCDCRKTVHECRLISPAIICRKCIMNYQVPYEVQAVKACTGL